MNKKTLNKALRFLGAINPDTIEIHQYSGVATFYACSPKGDSVIALATDEGYNFSCEVNYKKFKELVKPYKKVIFLYQYSSENDTSFLRASDDNTLIAEATTDNIFVYTIERKTFDVPVYEYSRGTKCEMKNSQDAVDFARPDPKLTDTEISERVYRYPKREFNSPDSPKVGQGRNILTYCRQYNNSRMKRRFNDIGIRITDSIADDIYNMNITPDNVDYFIVYHYIWLHHPLCDDFNPKRGCLIAYFDDDVIEMMRQSVLSYAGEENFISSKHFDMLYDYNPDAYINRHEYIKGFIDTWEDKHNEN